MLGVKTIRRKLRRRALRRAGYRPEEEAFERFAQRFGPAAAVPKGGTQEEPKEENQQDLREEPHEEPHEEEPRREAAKPPAPPSDPALAVLGLEAGASPEEIATAYRRMAHTYHPDKVAGESREVREYAERRMKEINAAYSELKLRAGAWTAGGTG